MRLLRTGIGPALVMALVLAAVTVGLLGGTDAGASAGPSASIDVPQLVTAFDGTSVLYVLSSTCRDRPCLHLSRTDDDGATFTAVTAPPSSASGGSATGTIRQLLFPTPLDGIATEGPATSARAGATFYATTDGAARWTKETFGAGVTVLAAAGSTSGYFVVVARCVPGAERCSDTRLLRSALSPLVWTPTALSNQAGLGLFGAKVTAIGTDVWISEAMSNGAPRLAVSTDDGSSFSSRSPGGLAAVTPCALFAVTQISLWASCVTGLDVSFVHSGNGGANWTPAKVGPVADTGGGGFAPVTPSVAFVAAGGATRDLYRVTGTTGVAAKRDTLPYVSLASLIFTSTTDGLLIGTPVHGTTQRLASTANGGRTWTTRTSP
jgi:hypothetical protein